MKKVTINIEIANPKGKAYGTSAWIKNLLENSTVRFSTTKEEGFAGAWLITKIGESESKTNIMTFEPLVSSRKESWEIEEYRGMGILTKPMEETEYYNGIFSGLTPAAYKIASEFIQEVKDKFKEHINDLDKDADAELTTA